MEKRVLGIILSLLGIVGLIYAGVTFMKPDEERTNAFTDYLIKNKINVRVRRSRGKDIDAACGQLANKDV